LPPLRISLLLALAVFMACAPTPSSVHLRRVEASLPAGSLPEDDPLLARASFDLACPASQVALVYVDDRSQGARGCGRQVRFVRSCPRCKWQRDGEVVRLDDSSLTDAGTPTAANDAS